MVKKGGRVIWPVIKKRVERTRRQKEEGGGGKVAVVVDTRGGDSANQVAADWRC